MRVADINEVTIPCEPIAWTGEQLLTVAPEGIYRNTDDDYTEGTVFIVLGSRPLFTDKGYRCVVGYNRKNKRIWCAQPHVTSNYVQIEAILTMDLIEMKS